LKEKKEKERKKMRELSLFSGAGGGLLGTKLLGWRSVGYVEKDEYCQRVIAARIKDGYLENAPIFTDIRAFNDSGCAELYRGVADCISAGFPCQPWSVVGKRLGKKDKRNLWPETIRTIRLVRPGFCFLENVPGLLTSDYYGTILGELAEYVADNGGGWIGTTPLSAAHVGADHIREREWIYANLDTARLPWWVQADANGAHERIIETRDRLTDVFTSALPGKHGEDKPVMGRGVHGPTARVDRIKAIGNMQVPAVAATAWRLLANEHL
jgi:DNA (cytosine-5)-methyltransferase 1